MSLPSQLQFAESCRLKQNYAAAHRAVDNYEKLASNEPDAWNVRSLICLDQGDIVASKRLLRRAVEASGHRADYRLNLALPLLHAGEGADGWRYYEGARAGIRWRRARRTPLWQGESLDGARVFVFQEQGLGDFIRFARLLRHLAEPGARVTVRCDQRPPPHGGRLAMARRPRPLEVVPDRAARAAGGPRRLGVRDRPGDRDSAGVGSRESRHRVGTECAERAATTHFDQSTTPDRRCAPRHTLTTWESGRTWKLIVAFTRRREALSRTGKLGVQVVGTGHCRDTNLVREILCKNFVPFTWVDSESPGGTAALALHGPSCRTPVVDCGSGRPRPDRDPCPLEMTLPGVLATGDVRSGSTKRAGFAVGDG
jgi:hypothetical protein